MATAVIDTNVLFSRYASPRGAPAQVFSHLERRSFQMIVTPSILAEYRAVLSRPKMRDEYGLSDNDRENALSVIGTIAIVVIPSGSFVGATADPKDDMFIEAAVAGEADFIVSGDKHLLALGTYQGILIVPPAAFVAYLESISSESR